MHILFFLFLLFCYPLQSEGLSLKEQLAKATEQSWIVTEQNKNYIFFYIREINSHHVLIEEVTLPGSCCRAHFDWKHWFETGAPGHTLWTLTQINLQTATLEKSYSYTHQKWLTPSQSFMTTLLNLDFTLVPEEERKRVGLPPSHRKADHRPFWQPKVVMEGQKVPNVTFTAWHTRWPADGSDLSYKRIEIYLPKEDNDCSYPTYFPYLLEVEGKVGSAKVRIIDSGLYAISPQYV